MMDLKRYLVIVADRQKGRYFIVFGDTFEDEGELIKDEVPQKVKEGGFRAKRIDRHIRDHLYKHLKHVGEKAYEYIKKSPKSIKGVLVGGHDEMIPVIIKHLPAELQRKVIGQFVADTEASILELMERAKEGMRLRTFAGKSP